MAPVTRSSAPTTPCKPTVDLSSGVPGSSPRRAPHCTKCGRPRAGHPRSGCPYAPQSNPPSPKPISRATDPRSADDALALNLSSLSIVNTTKEEKVLADQAKGRKRRLSVRFALIPAETLASLSGTDVELVDRLLAPGMMNATCDDEDGGAVLRWRKTLVDAEPPSREPGGHDLQAMEEKTPIQVTSTLLSRSMPCTLSTPTASLTSTEPLSDANIGGSINMNDTIFLLPDPDVKKTRPLRRTMSTEQRSLFLERLSNSSNNPPATLVSIQKADIEAVRKDAEREGLIVRVLSSEGEGNQQWIMLGTDTQAMDLLGERFSEEDRKTAKARRGGQFSVAAGGALFGAVATWTGLAFI